MARKTPAKKRNVRLSPAQWIEAEELYRNGWTQQQLSDKFGIRIESISRHMTSRGVKGGEKAEIVRREIQAAIERKTREFAESKAQRQIDAKDMLYKMNNALLATFAKEFRDAQVKGYGLASLGGTAKALKDAIMSLKLGREEVYAILEIKDGDTTDELPSLEMHEMSAQDEENLRSQIAEGDDDEELETAAEQMAEVVDMVEKTASNLP